MGEIIVRPRPPIPLAFTGERLTTEYHGQTEIEHLHRYLLAREWCRGKDVLDVASGEGYGTALLAQVAGSATGVELAEEVVDHARKSYGGATIKFLAGDARELPCPDASFDVVVSFETIEHFAEHDRFLAEIRRVLRPGGLLIVSTPDRDNYSPAETPANPYHVNEVTRSEFDVLLRGHFAEVAMVLQRPVFGSVLMPAELGQGAPSLCFERRGDNHFEASRGLSRPQFVVAFASDQLPGAVPPSVYIETGRLGMASPAEIETRWRSAEASQRAHIEELESRLLDANEAAQARAREIELRLRQTETLLEAERQRAEAAERAHLEAAASDRACDEQHQAELQSLRLQLATDTARLKDEQSTLVQEYEAKLEASRTELASAHGEAKGLLAANELAERAITALHGELRAMVALRGEVSIPATIVDTGESAEMKLALAQHRAEMAETLVRALQASTSWRITAPLRALRQSTSR